MKFYKVLRDNAVSPYAYFDYANYLPKGEKPGKWLPAVKGHITICGNGYHVAAGKLGLHQWVDRRMLELYGCRVFLVEPGKRSKAGQDRKTAFSRIRLVRELTCAQVLKILYGKS